MTAPRGLATIRPKSVRLVLLDQENAKAFALMAVPDQKGKTFLCGQRHGPDTNPDLKPADATYGKYYLSASQLNFGDEESPPLLLLWAKEKDRWKVISWAVELP